jgi:hypothetical protein
MKNEVYSRLFNSGGKPSTSDVIAGLQSELVKCMDENSVARLGDVVDLRLVLTNAIALLEGQPQQTTPPEAHSAWEQAKFDLADSRSRATCEVFCTTSNRPALRTLWRRFVELAGEEMPTAEELAERDDLYLILSAVFDS